MEHVSKGDCGRMTEDEARIMFRQLMSALQNCHQRGIVHRDLKPENMLIDNELSTKFTDFGLSIEFIGHRLSMAASRMSSQSSSWATARMALQLTGELGSGSV